MKRPTSSIVLDTHIKSTQKFNVKLRITFNRKPKYFSTGIDLTKEEFINRNKDRKLKAVNLRLNEIEQRAEHIIDSLQPFSFESFQRKLLNNSSQGSNVYRIFQEQITDLRKQQRIKNAAAYEGAMNSLKKFKPELKLSEITVEFLRKFQQWHIDRGNSISTVGIHVRQLRAIYNLAVKEELVDKSDSPFRRDRYVIPKGLNSKRALTITEVGLLFNYQPKTSSERKALDFWKFAYLCSGMNFIDIARLKFSNLDGDTIRYIRKKTQNTKATTEHITVPVRKEVLPIIEKWGNNPEDKSNYVFPILRRGENAVQDNYRLTEFRDWVNKYTKKISASLGISKKVTSYVARHSFATVLHRNSVDTLMIQGLMGHSNMSVTQQYLADFEIDEQRKATDFLIPPGYLKAV